MYFFILEHLKQPFLKSNCLQFEISLAWKHGEWFYTNTVLEVADSLVSE